VFEADFARQPLKSARQNGKTDAQFRERKEHMLVCDNQIARQCGFEAAPTATPFAAAMIGLLRSKRDVNPANPLLGVSNSPPAACCFKS